MFVTVMQFFPFRDVFRSDGSSEMYGSMEQMNGSDAPEPPRTAEEEEREKLLSQLQSTHDKYAALLIILF